MQSLAFSAVARGSFWELECQEDVFLRPRCHSEPTLHLVAELSFSDDDGKSSCEESAINTACGDSDSESAPESSRGSVSTDSRSCWADVVDEGLETRSESDFNGSLDRPAPEDSPPGRWPAQEMRSESDLIGALFLRCWPAQEVVEPACASLGSMGHPFSCGAACKYASKKGCKDGAACSHCHLCQWSSKDYAKSRKLQRRASRR